MKTFNRPNRKYKPKTWSRKGECPSCRVGQGSKHNSKCTFKYVYKPSNDTRQILNS